jgi:hypothetical protein
MAMVRTACLVIGLALATSACNDHTTGPEADQAVTQFYQNLAARNYHAIYADASPELQQNVSEANFTGFLARVDRKLGACQPAVKAMSWNVNYTPNGVFRSQGFTRACANGTLTENVAMVVRGGQAKLYGYHADSPLLLTD